MLKTHGRSAGVHFWYRTKIGRNRHWSLKKSQDNRIANDFRILIETAAISHQDETNYLRSWVGEAGN